MKQLLLLIMFSAVFAHAQTIVGNQLTIGTVDKRSAAVNNSSVLLVNRSMFPAKGI